MPDRNAVDLAQTVLRPRCRSDMDGEFALRFRELNQASQFSGLVDEAV